MTDFLIESPVARPEWERQLTLDGIQKDAETIFGGENQTSHPLMNVNKETSLKRLMTNNE